MFWIIKTKNSEKKRLDFLTFARIYPDGFPMFLA